MPNYGYDSSISNINGGAWATRLRNAIAEWNGVSSGEGWFFWYRYDNANANRTKALDLRGDSRCTVVPGGCLALTYKYGNPYNRFDVVINVGSGHSFYDGTQSPTLPSNYYDLRTIFRHEFGHAAGICHSGVSSAVMRPAFSTGSDVVITADDRNALRYLYKPGYTLTSPSGSCIN